jgi:hypothetical protein
MSVFTISELEKLEEAKRRYIEARVIYEYKLTLLKAAMEPFNKLYDWGKISLNELLDFEEKAEDAVELDEAFKQLVSARDELINTAKPMLLKIAKPEDKEALEKVFAAKYSTIKEELADVILKWDATGG